MRNRSLVLLLSSTLLVVILAQSCGKKKETTEPDWSSSLMGRWTGEVQSEVNGDKIRETNSVSFYYTGSYRWDYTYRVNGEIITDKTDSEEGTFVATEITITFTPDKGEPRTLAYELTGRSDILLILSDGDGNVWNFDDVWFPAQTK